MTSAVNLLGDVEASRTHVALIHFLRTVDHQHKEANYSTSHGLQHKAISSLTMIRLACRRGQSDAA